MIRTAIPFGYLIAAVAMLAVAALGLMLLVRGLSRRNYRHASVGAAVVLFAAYVIGVNIAEDGKLDLNPRVDATTISGRWTHAGAVLQLRPNGRYECFGRSVCEPVGNLGTWILKDGDIALSAGGVSTISAKFVDARYRVASYDGVLRLASPMDGDPDTWDGKFYWRLLPPLPGESLQIQSQRHAPSPPL